MASGKLDQSLDEIMKDGKSTRSGRPRPGNRPRRAANAAKAKIAAPAGGISKNTKPARNAKASNAPAPTGPKSGDSKIIVSNLVGSSKSTFQALTDEKQPEDVDELQIKDYFTKIIGPVKRAMLTYGPTGRSRGVATIIFSKPNAAADAAKALNGVKVDNKAMKIEVVVEARNVNAAPQKTLSDRIAQQPKNAAKEGKKGKGQNKAVANGAKPAKAGKKSGRAGRPKPKTTEELDAEMQDYFGGDTNGTATTVAVNGNGTAAAPDASMDVIS